LRKRRRESIKGISQSLKRKGEKLKGGVPQEREQGRTEKFTYNYSLKKGKRKRTDPNTPNQSLEEGGVRERSSTRQLIGKN